MLCLEALLFVCLYEYIAELKYVTQEKKMFLYLHACSVAHLCLTLCNSMDCSPSGFSVHGISQARILEWVSLPSSGDLPTPGIKSTSLCIWQVDALLLLFLGSPLFYLLVLLVNDRLLKISQKLRNNSKAYKLHEL